MNKNRIRLGVNLDHIAFIKKSRDTIYPSLSEAVNISEKAGANLITIHLREDRRHIQEEDAYEIKKCAKTVNLEMANTSEMVKFAIGLQPHYVCIVPEKREEKTTEGGLNLTNISLTDQNFLKNNIKILKEKTIKVSLFINPEIQDIEEAKQLGADIVELHTGTYANVFGTDDEEKEYQKLKIAAKHAHEIGLVVNAGHGLNYKNIDRICKIQNLNELNIGHSIIANAIFVGLKDAIEKIIRIINNCD
jgi:pyridoxine 5-phosphate synthase